MALANFFTRAATAASQVLNGFDLAAFEKRLEGTTVVVAFDAESARQHEGHTALELAVNLIARLYPTLSITGSGKNWKGIAEELEEFARSINPEIKFVRRSTKSRVTVAVGKPSVPLDGTIFWLGSDGWVARLSTSMPFTIGRTSNPFGASAAACFAVANIFRHFFADQLINGGPDTNLNLSLLNYSQIEKEMLNPSLSDADLGATELAGVGAIGNAFVWVLKRLPGLRGTLTLIDHEAVELSNLQRYVLTSQEHVGAAKAEIASRTLSNGVLLTKPFVGNWARYISSLADFRVERLAVALDSAQDRISVQAALPKQIFNSWTQTLDLGVSRHDFLGPNACLACLYLPQSRAPDEDEVVAQALGIADRMEIRRLLSHNLPVDRNLLARVATAHSLSLDALLPFENKPIRTFYTEAFCGGVVFRLSKGAKATPTLVPLAFQSALAGIMLAAEVVANAAGLKVSFSGPCTTTINLLRPLAPYLSIARAKDPHGSCMCQDADYIAAFKAKWS